MQNGAQQDQRTRLRCDMEHNMIKEFHNTPCDMKHIITDDLLKVNLTRSVNYTEYSRIREPH